MTGNIDTFRRGATAFRNARDSAQRHRDSFIQAANARARQSGVEASPEAEITVAVAEQYEESTDEFVDCEDYPASGDVDEEPVLPQYLCAEDEQSQDEPSQESISLGAEPAMSFATSFTSSFSQSQTSSKRTRPSHSPPSNSQPRKNTTGPRGGHAAVRLGERPDPPRRARHLQDLLYYSRRRLKNTGPGVTSIRSGTI
jgi:hypothetical protein